MANRKHTKAPKRPRNWTAVHAHFRSGAGSHGDARKESSRRACRGRVRREAE